eukprot:12359561-Alexandrium_andersonii.AAC.1
MWCTSTAAAPMELPRRPTGGGALQRPSSSSSITLRASSLSSGASQSRTTSALRSRTRAS